MLDMDALKIYLQELNMQNIWQVERDYMQHVILSAIYSSKEAVIGANLVFKGGTDLQKQNIIDRFSIDLDFTSNLNFENLKNILNYVKKYLEDLNIINTYSIEKNEKSVNVKFTINGPAYEVKKSDNAKVVIRLEISLREQIILEPDRGTRIVPVYKDIKPYVLISMDISEIASEKVRAIITRNKPRDVYDLWILIKKRYDIYEFLVRKKLEIYDMAFALDEFIERMELKRMEWNSELKNLLNSFSGNNIDMPDFDAAKNDIINYFINNISISFEFNLKNNKKEAAKNEKSLKFQCNKLIALTQKNVKITESAVYPNFNSILIAFAYKKYKALYLIINKHGASDDDAKKITLESICYPITTQKIGLNIAIKKNGGLNIWLLAANSEYKKINENIVINILLKAVE